MKVAPALRLGLLTLAAGVLGSTSAFARAHGGGSSNGQPHVPGYLGVDVRDVGNDEVAPLKLKNAHGAEIVQVDHDGPAGKVGLREHDVVLMMNGQAIGGQEQIRRLLKDMAPGRTVVLTISRDGAQMVISAQMSNRELVERQAWEQHMIVPEPMDGVPSGDALVSDSPPSTTAAAPTRGMARSFLDTILMSPAYTGAMLEVMGPQLAQFFGAADGKGLLIRSVSPNSPAAQAGMKAGDVAIRANSKPLAKTSDWARMIHDSHGHAITVIVLRDKKQQTLTLVPDEKRRSSVERAPGPQQAAGAAPQPL